MQKHPMSFWQIWSLCFGFLGIQIGFELQVTNTSRIFETLGAQTALLPILWIAAPLTGLIVQPLVGYFSDKTWTPLGRRRPYFLVGAILASVSLIAMPNAGLLWIAVGVLWIKDAALNITMEPFRAFVGDNLPDEQRATGYALQSFFIGLGAVVAAGLAWAFTNWFGLPNTAPAGEVPPSVQMAYYVGGVALFGAVMWTILGSKEYSPEQLDAFEKARREQLGAEVIDRPEAPASGGIYVRNGVIWIVAGAALAALVWGLRATDATRAEGEKLFEQAWQLYILAALVGAYGLVQIVVGRMGRRDGPASGDASEHDSNRDSEHASQLASGADISAPSPASGLAEIIEDLYRMPTTMRQLAVVQFFTWFGLFAMWIFGGNAVAGYHFDAPLDPVSGLIDTTSGAYNDASDWWGVLSSVRNGVAVLAAIAIIWLSRKVRQTLLHAVNLLIGAAGLASLYMIEAPSLLWISMVGVGIAWASIVSVPYSILASAVPARKMGVYMGIFNVFIVIPQLLAATVLGLILNAVFQDQAIFMFFVAAGAFVCAGVASLFVRDAVADARQALAAAGSAPASASASASGE